MKYIKLFEDHSNYIQYMNGIGVAKPNLSYCSEQDHFHLTPFDPFNGHDYVDLGLPSGTLWATKNVGAETENDIGSYFKWGGIVPDADDRFYDSETESYTKYNLKDMNTQLDLEDDAAHLYMGGSWHMPTREQLYELMSSQYTTITKGIDGPIITSKTNGESIQFVGWSTSSYTYLWSSDAIFQNYQSGYQIESGTTAVQYKKNNSYFSTVYYGLGRGSSYACVRGVIGGGPQAVVGFNGLYPNDYDAYLSTKKVTVDFARKFKGNITSAWVKLTYSDPLVQVDLTTKDKQRFTGAFDEVETISAFVLTFHVETDENDNYEGTYSFYDTH